MSIIANKKIGRSIEEIIVRRKFDSSNPVTWPDGHPSGKSSKVSQSMSNLNIRDSISENGSSTAPSTAMNTARPHVRIVNEAPSTAQSAHRGRFDYLADYSEEDKIKMMESLIRYTKALQDRVEVSE